MANKSNESFKYWSNGIASREIKRTKNKSNSQKYWGNGTATGTLFPKGLPVTQVIIV